MLKNKKNILRSLALLLLIGASLAFAQLAGAQIDVGTNEISNTIALGSTDPRTTVARIINVVMLILGVLAVGLIVWAGFIWMTSNGEEDKVDQAKKILRNGVIGLVIVLSAWGIASFILSRLMSATNGNGGVGVCTNGQSLSCGCGGSMSCIDDSWGPCLGSDCGGGVGPTSCDSSPLGGCQAADQICASDDYCDAGSCECLPKGQLGDSCDADQATPTCEADNNRCAEYLSCDATSCTCYGPPVITDLSPVGGFCQENQNLSCDSDDDCTVACNLITANGAVDNVITISGVNFGAYDSLNSKVIFGGDMVGVAPATVNPDCINSWTNNQIIIVVPSGAISGAIKVVTADNQSDLSNDDNGPVLNDFIVNGIVRPGLCLLTPEAGLLSEQVNYRGVNLYSGQAYFGNYNKNVRGLDSVFVNPAGLAGTSTIPNLNRGKMSSFVVASVSGNHEKSNYVSFIKEEEPDAGPFISYFEPPIGRAGQYVTIHGGGFGGARSTSQVFFGDVEADYAFPEVCANSVWRDKQIIVKVPASLNNGSYEIKVNLGDTVINSQNANPNAFTANVNLPLKTSICKISPQRGQIGTPVSIWGEYFGDENANALAVFTSNRSVSSQINSDQGAQLVEASVPENAVTGPVKIVKNNEWGNDVNFEIGVCTENSECGQDVCCPAGTYKQGRCAPALGDCYIDIPNSVFEWGFSTGFGGIGTTTDYDSCQGMAQTLGACQVGAFCPNSPGLCSPFAGGSKTLGSCDDTCASVPACLNQVCNYNDDLDACVVSASTCSLESTLNYNLNGTDFSATQSCKAFTEFGGQNHWEIKTSASCPNGWTRLAGDRCVDDVSAATSSCSLCANGFNCKDVNTIGRCVTTELCAGSAASCSGNSCVATEAARCDCCCEIGQDARDCCAPLTCTGTCGSDTAADGAGLGQCSGCSIDNDNNGSISPAEQVLSDQACNCSSHSGKFCDVSVPTGACVDCSKLSPSACTEHSQSCCLDSKGTLTDNDDVCRGGSGQEITSDPANPDFGYCAYFDCQNASSTPPGDPSLCASTTPKTFGLFKNIDSCGDNCATTPGLSFCGQFDGDLLGCGAATGCCFNFADQQCNGGSQMAGGYCAYFNCQDAPNNDQCNPNPIATGTYNSLTSCATGCSQPPLGGLGKDCRNLNTTSTTECNQSFCSSPFSCLNNTGSVGLPGDCGTCCCQVSNPNSCAGVGSGSLVCQPNQAPCSGNDRGLCCGCSQDNDCGNAATLGCDSGTCCRARPEVITDQLEPAHGSTGICRNASIKIPFDQAMDVSSLMNNIILLEENDYGTGVCPAGTFLASLDDFDPIKKNWFVRTYARLSRSIKTVAKQLGLSSSDALAIVTPSATKLYCSVPGNISVSHNGNGSIAEFQPKKILAANSNYYLIVKGDEALDSNSGVLSQWQIGLNGRGYNHMNISIPQGGWPVQHWIINHLYIEGVNYSFNNLRYANSDIFSFTTLAEQGANAGICAVDYVNTEPASYLFQSTDDDLNEDDTMTASSFDTKSDRDKLFTARAYSTDGQLLHPSSGYYWEWDWNVVKPSVASLSALTGLPDNQAFVEATSGVTDDSTILAAQINMDRFSAPSCNATPSCVCAEPNCLNNCCNYFQDGDDLKVETPLFVFLCKNPWPAANPATQNWAPWYDTCTGAIGNCSNYNYKFYYCRDAGNDGLSDDLPAMTDPAVIRGTGNVSVCSEGQTACSVIGSRCGADNNYDGQGDGFCIWNVLKESYFFKEATPQVGAITAAIDQEDGNTVRLEWYGNSSLIYNAVATKMGKYRIYYSPVSAGNMNYIDLKPTDIDPNGSAAPICTPSVPAAGANYSCHFYVPNLTPGTSYRFKVSAITAAQVESPLSGEQTATVSDGVPPATPQGFSGSTISQQRLKFTWSANTDDAQYYRLYHGVASSQFGESFDSDDKATSLEIDSRQFNAGVHYFTLTALDSSENESPKATQVTLTIAQ